MSKNILLVVGSQRQSSFNQQLADEFKRELEAQGASVRYLDYKNIPVLHQDSEYPTPSEIQRVRNEVLEADGIVFVSPEYNGSYPAILKNLIDWLSRPIEQGNRDYTALVGKPVTVAGAAGSTFAKFMRQHMNTLTTYVRMNTMPGEGFGMQIPGESWATNVLTFTPEQKQDIANFVSEYLTFVG